MRGLVFSVLVLASFGAAAMADEPATPKTTSEAAPAGCLLHNLPQTKPPTQPKQPGAPTVQWPPTVERQGPLDRLGQTDYCGPNIYEPAKTTPQKTLRPT